RPARPGRSRRLSDRRLRHADRCERGRPPGGVKTSTVMDGAQMMAGPVPRPGILDIAPYVGGESKADPGAGAARPIRLASNEGALGPSPRAMAALRAMAGELHRYPDGGSTALREALGRHHGLD